MQQSRQTVSDRKSMHDDMYARRLDAIFGFVQSVADCDHYRLSSFFVSSQLTLSVLLGILLYIYSTLLSIATTIRPNLLLEAPPGAGKTTVLPLALLTELSKWRQHPVADASSLLTNILVVQPRRVAARSAAARMTTLLHQEHIGETVGYAIRGETRVSSTSKITVVTDGVLLQRLRTQPDLAGIDAVVLDEFHERGVNSDTALALLLEMQQLLRPDLRIIVMSATLFDESNSEDDTTHDPQENRLFQIMGGQQQQQCTILRSRGERQYPTTIQWAKRGTPPLPVLLKSRRDLVDVMCYAIQDAAQRAPARGDVLAFLPGAREIQMVVQQLRDTLGDRAEVLPLYGSLPKLEQDYAIHPPDNDQGPQRIIVASPIAEASLTLERVTAVVDSGLRREPRCDVDTGMPRLVTCTCSKASAKQRAGRAGRTQEGLVLRIYTEADMGRFLDHSRPEILNTDLVPTVLLLTDWGCSRPSEIYKLPLIDPPQEDALQRAYATLVDLAALQRQESSLQERGTTDDRYTLSSHGREICKLPTHPRLATAIVRAETPEHLVAAVTTAAFLDDEAGIRFGKGTDLRLRIRDVLNGNTSAFVQKTMLRYAARMGHQAKEALETIMEDPSRINAVMSVVGEALLPGFIDLVAERKGDASYGGSTYMLSLGRSARLDDANNSPDFVVVAETTTGDDGITRIRSYAPISKESLFQVAQEKDVTFTVPSRGHEVRCRRCLMVGSLELSSTPLPSPPPEEISKILLETIRSMGGVKTAILDTLSKDNRASVDELRARVRLATSLGSFSQSPSAFTALDALDDGSAAESAEQIKVTEELIEPWLASAGSLKKLNLHEILQASLSCDQQMELDQFFPKRIIAPDGTRIPIQYATGTPTASAKLQQFFGTTKSPTVGPPGATMPVMLSLLSPSGKPLAQTADLPFFWKEAYPAVRSEMRGRYAKHPWPEDPLTATPTRQTKKQQVLTAEGDGANSGDSTGGRSSGKKRTKKRRR